MEKILDQLKEEIEKYKDEIVCFIYEPLLQGAGGMLMYQPKDLNSLLHLFEKRKNYLYR